MKLKNAAPALLAVLVLTAVPSASADAFARLARRLGDAARAAGLKRVAVSRFESADGFGRGRGAELSERLVVSLVRDGRVQTVERSLLGKLADEASLDRTGAVAGGAQREVSLAPVDALVVGRYETDGRGVRVFVRVVDARTGVIAGAASAEIADDSLAFDPFAVPVPRLQGAFPPLDAGETLRDAPADQAPSSGGACAGAAARVDALQSAVLELKARFWAFRLRLGVDAASVSVNPGSTIPDSALRERFYARLRHWHAAAVIPPMTRDELGRLTAAEGRSYELVRDCGL